MTRTYHDPVMVREVVAHLGAESGGLYFDGTLGGGGRRWFRVKPYNQSFHDWKELT